MNSILSFPVKYYFAIFHIRKTMSRAQNSAVPRTYILLTTLTSAIH